MLRDSKNICALIACCSIFLGGNIVSADEATTVFQDDFSDAKGAKLTNTGGTVQNSDQPATRTTFTFISDYTSGGDIALSITEDQETKGPDDKPGILAMAFEKVPTSAEYSGFVYAGRVQKPINLPLLTSNATDAELKRVKLSFRYKAANAEKNNVGATYNCRFEPEVEEAYEYRVDFGQLEATDKWQTFEKTLSDGENTYEFLGALKNNTTNSFKFAFGQEGEISEYQSGDTLLLDDVKITVSNK